MNMRDKTENDKRKTLNNQNLTKRTMKMSKCCKNDRPKHIVKQ